MNKKIKIEDFIVPVDDKIYEEYCKMKEKQEYIDYEIKSGINIIFSKKEKIIGYTIKESIESYIENVKDIYSKENLDNIIINREIIQILMEGINMLNENEQKIIYDIFYRELRTDEIVKKYDISETIILKYKKKILRKLRIFFKKNGY